MMTLSQRDESLWESTPEELCERYSMLKRVNRIACHWKNPGVQAETAFQASLLLYIAAARYPAVTPQGFFARQFNPARTVIQQEIIRHRLLVFCLIVLIIAT